MVKQHYVVSGSAYMHMFHPPGQSMSLVGTFIPFTFKVIINMYDPIAVFLIVLGLFFVGKSFSSLVFSI